MAKLKLVCDKCGFELVEKEEIALVFDCSETWQAAQREKGKEPRGLFPCMYYAQDEGELIVVTAKEKKKILSAHEDR